MEIKTLIDAALINNALTYSAYRKLIDKLLAEGKTTGPVQEEWIVTYTKLNKKRMDRLDKTIVLSQVLTTAINNIREKWIWLIITEGWCGDAAQNIPLLNKIAEHSAKIELKLLLRDEHTELMDAYLTNGSRAIPKLICLRKDDLKEMGTWGPRPEPLQKMVLAAKAEAKSNKEAFSEKIHTWYAKDKTNALQHEMTALITHWNL